jgi:CBS domain-containing protein
MNPKEIVRVRDVMRHDIDIISGMTTLSDALLQMEHLKNKMLIVDKRHVFERLKLSRAPVMDNGKLVGVVSLTRMVLHGIRK